MNTESTKYYEPSVWSGCLLVSVIVALLALAYVGLMLLMTGIIAPIEFVIYVTVGWAIFLERAWSQMQFNPGGCYTAVTALLLFAFGLHQFLKWLYLAIHVKTYEPSPDSTPSARQVDWKLRWTGYIVVLTCIMFVAGISMIGFTHQIVWLVTSKEKLAVTRGLHPADHDMHGKQELPNPELAEPDAEM